jgi:dTDP-4-amino-4,6-dideoxygalactose transaminase
VGSSYLPAELLAGFLYAQLEDRERIQETRRAIWTRYDETLRDWAAAQNVRLPIVPPECEQAYHMYHLLMPSLERRQALIAYLRERGIMAVFHYVPLHLSPVGRRLGGVPGQCPVTEHVSDRLVRLPFFNDLGVHDQDRVIEAVLDFGR